jgi:hypothetical protein
MGGIRSVVNRNGLADSSRQDSTDELAHGIVRSTVRHSRPLEFEHISRPARLSREHQNLVEVEPEQIFVPRVHFARTEELIIDDQQPHSIDRRAWSGCGCAGMYRS